MIQARRAHPKSRPLPPTLEPEMPAHLRTLILCAMAGTLRAPIGSSLPQIYLAAARALIDTAKHIQEALDADR